MTYFESDSAFAYNAISSGDHRVLNLNMTIYYSFLSCARKYAVYIVCFREKYFTTDSSLFMERSWLHQRFLLNIIPEKLHKTFYI